MLKNPNRKIKRSLAFVKFKASLENEIRLFWHILAGQEYAARWLKALPTPTISLAAYPGDGKNPFSSINISVTEYNNHTSIVQASVRENAIVSFVTAFEYYLFETMKRLIFLDNTLINDSSLAIDVKEIAKIDQEDLKRWLANKVADKYLRNKTHAEMIKRIDTFSKAGVSHSKKDLIEEWGKWSLVRNSVVHTSRFITSELALAWPERFPRAGDPLRLIDKDIARVHSLALEISVEIDKRAVETIIKDNDAALLARELFVQYGTEDAGAIRLRLNHILQSPLTMEKIKKIISQQKKNIKNDDWTLSHGDLLKISS